MAPAPRPPQFIEAQDTGLSPIPSILAAEHMEEYAHGLPIEHYAAALATGKMVVVQPFHEVIATAPDVQILTEKQIEERRSAHGVTFGRLHDNANGKHDNFLRRNGPMSVALKPFSSSHDAVRELQGYINLRDIEVPTFEPVGIFPAKEGSHVIGVTLKNNDWKSLDRHSWVVGRSVDSERSLFYAEHNNKQVRGIAETLAFIHAHGIFHPDGQIKNWIANASDQIGVIDTEKQIVEPLGYDFADQLAWQDIEQLVESLVLHNTDDENVKTFGVGMLANLPLSVVRNSIEELVVLPYLSRLEHIAQDAEGDALTQVDMLYNGLLERFYNEDSWPQHFIDAN
jgi:hypothetical protein